MADYLKQQSLGRDERRKKLVRHWSSKIQRISLIVIVWLLALSVIYGFYYLLFEKGLFFVKNIEVDGPLVNVSMDAVRSSAKIDLNQNMFAVSLRDVQKIVSTVPWVKEAAVSRKLPSTIWIYVSEYVPFAVLMTDELRFVDREGVVFKEVEKTDDKNMPVLTGVVTDANLRQAIETLSTYLSSPLADYYTVSEVNIDPVVGYSIILLDEGTIIRVGFDGIKEKLERFFSMLSAIQAGHGKMRYVDLNVPGKVVVKYDS